MCYHSDLKIIARACKSIATGEKKEEKTMKIKTVAVLGSGAVGSYFVWGLMDKCKADLYVPAKARERRVSRLRESGSMERPIDRAS